jgi:hypothetical protein
VGLPFTESAASPNFLQARALGVDPASKQVLQCAWTNKTFVDAVYTHALDPRTNGSVSGIDWLWTDYDREGKGCSCSFFCSDRIVTD